MEELLSKDKNGELKRWLIKKILDINNAKKLERIFFFIKGLNRDAE